MNRHQSELSDEQGKKSLPSCPNPKPRLGVDPNRSPIVPVSRASCGSFAAAYAAKTCPPPVPRPSYLLAPSARLGRSAGLAGGMARLHRAPRSPRATGLGRNLCRWQLYPGQKRGPCVGVAKKGQGTKWMGVADGQSVALGTLLVSASPVEVTLIERTLARVSAPCRGRPRQKPDRLIDDKAAEDADALRKRLRARGSDRFSWLGNFRRLVVRWARPIELYRGFFPIAYMLITLNKLLNGF